MIKKSSLFRYSILFFFLIGFAILALLHQFSERSFASVDALCPFGGFETLISFILTGDLVPRILMSGLVLAIGIILTVIIFRRGFCGYICPFGTVQELLGKITKKKYNLPTRVDSVFRYLKYVILFGVLFGTTYFGTLVFRNYDPFITFFHFGKGIFWGELETTAFLGFAILLVTLLISVFIERAWCKYFCPLGAIMAMVTKLGLTKITRDSKKCTNCKSCDRNCPMNVDISKVKFVNSTECINCNTCISQCPTKALSLNVKSKTISSNWYAILMILVFFSVIGISMMFGIWKSSNTLDLSNSTVLKAEDLRGWMTLNDVSQGTRIPLTVLYSGMNLSSDVNSSMQLKEIASKYNITNFETESVRTFLITYQGETQ